LTPEQRLLRNLAGEIESHRREYLSKDEAYVQLKKMTGQDFGYDVEKWRDWFRQQARSRKR
jgi:hypothetical protein